MEFPKAGYIIVLKGADMCGVLSNSPERERGKKLQRAFV